MPKLKFLDKPHNCNYCYAVSGFTHARFGERQRRLHWVACICGKKHYVCFGCARKHGSVTGADGRRRIAVCAKRYYWKNVRPNVAANGEKGA